MLGVGDKVYVLVREKIWSANVVNYDTDTGWYALWLTTSMIFVNEQSVAEDRETLEIIRRNRQT